MTTPVLEVTSWLGQMLFRNVCLSPFNHITPLLARDMWVMDCLITCTLISPNCRRVATEEHRWECHCLLQNTGGSFSPYCRTQSAVSLRAAEHRRQCNCLLQNTDCSVSPCCRTQAAVTLPGAEHRRQCHSLLPWTCVPVAVTKTVPYKCQLL